MILLDSNVISEILRGDVANPGVVQWVWNLPTSPVTTVFNRAELLSGVALMPKGRRREALRSAVESLLSQLDVCLPFTIECADRYGDIVARRAHVGRPVGTMDALIASIALEAGATVATRDVSGFAGVGLDVINPWDEEAGP